MKSEDRISKFETSPGLSSCLGIRSSIFDLRPSRPGCRFRSEHGYTTRALTLVELLIVIIVIGILVSSILVASSGMINKGRSNNTQALLQVVADAVEEFKREQTAKPTITRFKDTKKTGVGDPAKTTISYAERYGNYPPDELEVFSMDKGGLPGLATPRSLAPGSAVVIAGNPTTEWGTLRFYRDGSEYDDVEYRDQVAMIVAIEMLSETASAVLERIPDRNRSIGLPQPNGDPALFLDRPDPATGTPNGRWDSYDHQIRYIIDDWGAHISYLAQRDWKPPPFKPIPSSNHKSWNEASTELIRLNGGQPIIMSYGPNGKDQLKKEAMYSSAKVSLVGDFKPEAPSPEDAAGIIDNPLNADNLYSNPALKEKLAKGIKP